MRYLLTFFGFILLSGVSNGQNLKYGFDGDMSTVLSESLLTDNTHPMQQVAGRLIYHNNGQSDSDTTTGMEVVGFKSELGKLMVHAA